MKNAISIGLVLAAVIAVGACNNVFNYERMRYTDSVRPFEQVMPDPPAGTIPAAPPTLKDVEYNAAGGEALYRDAEIGDLVNPVPPEKMAESIKRGQQVYVYYCRMCHGHKYNGDGTVGQSFYPLPRDLRSTWVQEDMDDDMLFRSISYGAGEDPVLKKVRHPALFGTLSVADRWHVINWTHTLGVRDDKETLESGSYHEVDWIKNRKP